MSDLTPGQRWTDGPPPTVSGDALPSAPPPQYEGPPPGSPPPGGPPPPTESYPLPEPQSPRSGDNNIWLILTGVAVIVLLLGAIIYVISDDDDDEDGGGGGGLTATGETDSTDPTDPGGLGEPGGTDDPGGNGGDTTSTTTTSTTSTTTTVPVQQAQAQEGDCIAVTESGSFLGADSCDSGATPYRVKRVIDAYDTCPNQNHGGVISGDFQLCVEFNIQETYCYVFPRDPNTGGIGGWVTPASACEAAGTVHVIDVVPGATESDQGNLCTSEFQWNYWYEIKAPQAVVCVMEY